MFDSENLQEIWETIRQNKLRTFLTGFSVAWGIFMLMILLGAGNGLKNAAQKSFAQDATNSMSIYTGSTEKAYNGLQPGRNISFTNKDFDALDRNFEAINKLTSRHNVYGNNNVRYKDKRGDYSITGVFPDMMDIEGIYMPEGRFINKTDMNQNRKVVVIGNKVKQALFGRDDPKGNFLRINDISFKVVGVYKDRGGERENDRVYLPFTTGQKIFGDGNEVHSFNFTIGDMSASENKAFEEEIQTGFAQRHSFHPEDENAIYISNRYENYLRFMKLFNGIDIFIWIIGFGTLIAGIVGVSNIMIIVVKERTKEIGIRKAIGAQPGLIVKQILTEAILITAFAGYVGLVAGVGVLEVMASVIPSSDFFRNPEVNFNIAISATVLLVLAGAVAGFFPARRASKIKPIVALKEE